MLPEYLKITARALAVQGNKGRCIRTWEVLWADQMGGPKDMPDDRIRACCDRAPLLGNQLTSHDFKLMQIKNATFTMSAPRNAPAHVQRLVLLRGHCGAGRDLREAGEHTCFTHSATPPVLTFCSG